MTTWTNDELSGPGQLPRPHPLRRRRQGRHPRRGHRPRVNDRIDAAYHTKYGRYGARYVDPMVASRDTTLRLLPR
ncbi:DUF2255 family protein [Streptomyces sp. YKOK-I1]